MPNQNSKYKIWWDENDGMVKGVILSGNINERQSDKLKGQIFRIISQHSGGVLGLVDISKVSSNAPAGSRKVFAEILKHPGIKKIAFFGASAVARVVISFVIIASGHKNAKFFATEEESIKWLKAE